MKEIDRILFVSLNKDTFYKGMYIILNDQNYVDKFYANSDDKAKEIFRERYGKEK